MEQQHPERYAVTVNDISILFRYTPHKKGFEQAAVMVGEAISKVIGIDKRDVETRNRFNQAVAGITSMVHFCIDQREVDTIIRGYFEPSDGKYWEDDHKAASQGLAELIWSHRNDHDATTPICRMEHNGVIEYGKACRQLLEQVGVLEPPAKDPDEFSWQDLEWDPIYETMMWRARYLSDEREFDELYRTIWFIQLWHRFSHPDLPEVRKIIPHLKAWQQRSWQVDTRMPARESWQD